jgi:hypothetical protein
VGTGDDTGDDDGDEHGRPGWTHRPAVVLPLAAVVAALLVGVGLFVRAWNDRGPTAASVDRSVAGFRDDHHASATASLLRPAAGVYTYDASGTERLSLLSTTQAWGNPMPGTVTTDARGCWTIRFDFSTNHSQATTYCPAGRVLQEVTGSTSQTFDFVAASVTDVTDFVCDPPGQLIRLDATVGQSWPQTCKGHSPARGTQVTSAGTNTFLGREKVRIGGTTVNALHYRVDRGLTGDQTGTERTELWFHPDSGLTLRETRLVRVASPSPIGDVTYTEEGTFTLTSLVPRT